VEHAPASNGYFALRSHLLGAYRTRVLTGGELTNAGQLIYGHPDRFSLYGTPASQMEERGLRILGRTVIECTIDAYALAVAEIWPAPDPDAIVVDLFCGSGNFGHQLQRRLGGRAYASELDPRVYELTSGNFGIIGARVDLRHCDYRDMLGQVPAATDNDVYIVEPPWGPAFTADGLDLARTSPPVREILGDIRRSRHGRPCLVAIKTNDQIAGGSLDDAFREATYVRSATPPPTLPYGANMDFHVYRMDGGG
jgi:predicted RNA methylase